MINNPQTRWRRFLLKMFGVALGGSHPDCTDDHWSPVDPFAGLVEEFEVACSCGWKFKSTSMSDLMIEREKHQTLCGGKTTTCSRRVASQPPKEEK